MLSVDELNSAKHKKMLQIWLEWKGGKVVPHKSQIDPIALGPSLLPNLAMLEMQDDGKDYLYRLVGTELSSATDQDFTGETILSFFGSDEERNVLSGYEKSRLLKEPVCDLGDFQDRNRGYIAYQRLILPFELKGEVRIFLGCFDFDLDNVA